MILTDVVRILHSAWNKVINISDVISFPFQLVVGHISFLLILFFLIPLPSFLQFSSIVLLLFTYRTLTCRRAFFHFNLSTSPTAAFIETSVWAASNTLMPGWLSRHTRRKRHVQKYILTNTQWSIPNHSSCLSAVAEAALTCLFSCTASSKMVSA